MVERYGTTHPAANRTVAPTTTLSYRSPLIKIACSGKHHDVKVDDRNLQRLIPWVDAMWPCKSDMEIRCEPDPTFQRGRLVVRWPAPP
jgi:hypothetical protein